MFGHYYDSVFLYKTGSFSGTDYTHGASYGIDLADTYGQTGGGLSSSLQMF